MVGIRDMDTGSCMISESAAVKSDEIGLGQNLR